MSRTRHATGQRGERLAADFLRQAGYNIMATNWRCAEGELDIVARKHDVVVIVEVRSRSASSTETAFESIGARKQARLVAAAHAFLSAHGLEDAAWRLDVIGIALRPSGPTIEHVENALDW